MQMQNGSQPDYAVTINGVLPDIHTLGDEEKSDVRSKQQLEHPEQQQQVKRLGMNANTSDGQC